MSLSCSRYMYVKITLDRNVKTFIQCHIQAFNYFRGIPKTVKIDHLKAAIIEVDFYEPLTQRTDAAFAEHYGFLPNPCRVATPTDEGKVEANVKYVKENCFKGRDFQDMKEAEDFLQTWLSNVANARRHGTTGKIPKEEFEKTEMACLNPLPTTPFVFAKTSSALVNTACPISYSANYYSVPYTYIGCEVQLIEVNHLLKIYYKD